MTREGRTVKVTRAQFTGSVGPVRFVNGEAETDDGAVLAYCHEHPAFTVHDGDPLDVPTIEDGLDFIAGGPTDSKPDAAVAVASEDPTDLQE